MKKKILIVAPSKFPIPATRGGAIETTIDLLINQNESFNQLAFIVISTYEESAYSKSKKYRNTHFIWIKRNKFYQIINFFMRAIKKVFKNFNHLDGEIIKYHIRKQKPDLVVIHGNTYFLKCVSEAIDKEKIVFYVHSNLFANSNDKTQKFFAKLPGKIVCVSDFVKNETIKNTKVGGENIKVIHNPATIDFYLNRDKGAIEVERFKKEFKLNKSDKIVLFAGRIVKDKGIKELIEAFILMEPEKNEKLLIVGSFGSGFGSGDSDDEFKQTLMNLTEGYESQIIFTGYVPNRELYKYHLVSDIIVMPSLCKEAAGKVAIEAMVSGKALITTKMGGIPEYVTDGCGLLLDTNVDFVKKLSESLRLLLNNERLRLEMSKQALTNAERFHPEKYYKAYLSVLTNS